MICRIEQLICDECGYVGYEEGTISEETLNNMKTESGWKIIKHKEGVRHFCPDCYKRLAYYRSTNIQGEEL